MIEIYLTESESTGWDLNATVFPKGGIGGLAQEVTLTTIPERTFDAAVKATADLDLDTLYFQPAPDRWPVSNPKFQIINEGSHPDSDNLGNYRIKYRDEILGLINNFPRGSRGELIKEAIKIVADAMKENS